MREIKFRAWEVSILPDGTIRKTMYYTNDLICWGEVPSPMIDTGFIDVELEEGELWIWMQYTGLKDKKGIEIYEGDIVKATALYEVVGCVVWRAPKFKIYFKRVYSRNAKKLKYCTRALYAHDNEVIGNIYENPELLREDGKCVK